MNSALILSLVLMVLPPPASSFDVEGTLFSPDFECFPHPNETLGFDPIFKVVDCDTPGSRWDFNIVSQTIQPTIVAHKEGVTNELGW
jgi:hypothetical protein